MKSHRLYSGVKCPTCRVAILAVHTESVLTKRRLLQMLNTGLLGAWEAWSRDVVENGYQGNI